MVRYRLIDEYQNGWTAERGKENFFVSTPDDDEIEFGNSSIGSNRRNARLFAALCVRFGRLPLINDPEVVPVVVAAAGKSEIAGYLWAVHSDYYTPEDSYRPVEIAEQLDVAHETVTTYCRRVVNSVEDQRIH